MVETYLTLKEICKIIGLKHTTSLYHYKKKGLILAPLHINNIKNGKNVGGMLSVYPKSYLTVIKQAKIILKERRRK